MQTIVKLVVDSNTAIIFVVRVLQFVLFFISEVEGEEPVMDQIIITNGFVDERGHYLVNGNSYEIYDPYSNTVTVVVGPPPYTNGVTQPVLAAVSCQPVPLQPVDWYPPGSDWPTQGSAWTPSYPRSPQAESLNSPDQSGEHMTNFHGPDNQMPNLYQQPAYVVPGYMFNESLVYNGMLPSWDCFKFQRL